MSYPEHDDEFEDVTVAQVEAYADGSGWTIKRSDGWCFFAPANPGVIPAVGMAARFYGRGLGFTVRGLYLDGVKVFYRTAEEDEAKFRAEIEERDRERRYDAEKNRAATDARIAALPGPFRDRIARFLKNQPDFWWDGLGYELAVCEAAAAIAGTLKAAPDDAERAANEFRELGWAEQVARVPILDRLGLSGNQFGAACYTAHALMAGFPKVVTDSHAAICPLSGCKESGCVPTEAITS